MRNLILIAATFLLLAKTQAQINSANLSFQLSLPQGDYKKTYNKLGTGLLFGVVHQLKHNSCIGIGGEIGILQVSNADNTYTGYYHNIYHTYNISATNYILSVIPKLRANLFTFKNEGKVFIEFRIGTNIFFTYAAISHDYGYDIITNGPRFKIDSSFSHSSWALRAGLGPGIEMPVSKNKNLGLFFKCSYLYGSRAVYFSHPSIAGLQITLVPKQSKTSMLLAETGIRFKLFNKKNKIL
jgi:hypothetical protein